MLFAYQTAVLAAWVGAMPTTEALRRRSAVAPLALARGPGWVAEMAWLDGILAFANGDTKALVAARAALKVSGGTWTAYLDRSLGAFESALRGDRRAAASAMTALERELAEGSPFFVTRATPHVLLRGVDRLAAAEWLLDQGDGDRGPAAASLAPDPPPLRRQAPARSARLPADRKDPGRAGRYRRRPAQLRRVPPPFRPADAGPAPPRRGGPRRRSRASPAPRHPLPTAEPMPSGRHPCQV